jgi:hypothetical protein
MIMGKIEGMEDEEKDVSIYRTSNEKKRYWKLKKEALDRILWRKCFRRNYGPVVRQMTGDDPKPLKRETPGALSRSVADVHE